MKYLVLFAVLYIAYLVWRNGRAQEERQARRGTPPVPQQMVACAQCGLHLPQSDALRGRDGRFYCGRDHLLRAGG